MDEDERIRLKSFFLLSAKSMLYACNLRKRKLPIHHPMNTSKFSGMGIHQQDADCCLISAKMEEELSELPDEETKEYLETMGVADSGVSSLIKSTYGLLGL